MGQGAGRERTKEEEEEAEEEAEEEEESLFKADAVEDAPWLGALVAWSRWRSQTLTDAQAFTDAHRRSQTLARVGQWRCNVLLGK